MENKINVLWYSDAPNTSTGFGNVARSLLQELYATGAYSFDIVGINYAGDPYSHEKYPYRIYPAVMPLSSDEKARTDIYGFRRFLNMAASGNYDLIFILNDLFIMKFIYPQLLDIQRKLPKDKRFEIIIYFPVDSPLKKEWVTEVVSKTSFPVTYTQYAKNECLKHDPSLTGLPYIYHGIDRKIFFPFSESEILQLKQHIFGKHKDKYILLNVARNQPRKDMLRTFAAFKLFHDRVPNSFLFILAQANDVGGDLIELGKYFGLEWDKEWACPSPGTYGANQGYPIEVVNQIYNASDVVISTSLGEGFGLSIIEGMATKKPIVFPDNTALHELIGNNQERGWFVKSGDTLNNLVYLGNADNNQVRPAVDVYDMADVLEYVYSHPEEVKKKVERAYNEVWEWKDVCKEWVAIFDKAWHKVQVMRKDWGKTIGPNDLCPCGSGLKYKKCCGKF